MEIIRGKQTSWMDARMFSEAQRAYEQMRVDLGTGDGQFVRYLAQQYPRHLVIGVDACRENLQQNSRRAPANTLFVIANALALPAELEHRAAFITVNFPWGSLLEGLAERESAVIAGLSRLAFAGTQLDIRVNAGALVEAGWPLEQGAAQIQRVLLASGFAMRPAVALTAAELKAFPSTWAKRLAFGRDPRAFALSGVYG